MVDIGIMVEGQEDMTWERFFRLADAVEELGFDSLFRSDHLTALEGFPERATLALWPSLTALAQRTKRIRFGPMVCSMTFRHPAMVAKMAADVDVLSGGRLDLGLGAGWYRGEHEMFGIAYLAYERRLEMLEEGALIIKGLWSGQPFSFEGRHYRVRAAENHPCPAQAEPTLIMGGKGEKTLKVVARQASEWNFSYSTVEFFREKSRRLDEACEAIGRDPATLRRSLMTPFVIGRDPAALQAGINAQRRMFPSLPADHAGWLANGYVAGSPERVTEQIATFAAAGIQRFMLQHNDLDNLEALELLAQEVLPHFA
jgi:F420-dependent oxidoreductase-like protein